MIAKDPLYKKVLLHLNWMEDPIELWWTDNQINTWDLKKSRRLEFIRVESSPFSILEFDPDLYNKLVVTDEIRHRDSPYISGSTLFLKYLQQERMPIPKNPILGHFDYPVTFMGFLDSLTQKTKFMDTSNYMTYEFIKEDKIKAEDLFMNPDYWIIDNFPVENLLFVEYSKI